MGDDFFTKLAAPFPASAVSWRVGSTNRKKRQRETNDQNARATKGQALAFIDSRDVQARLDSVAGPAGWQCRYPHAGVKTVCEIGILLNGEWIWKADGAGDTDVEKDKGALSDAFKRAAVKWGIGRYLYDIPAPWVDLDQWGQIAHGEYDKLKRLLDQAAMPTQPPPAGVAQQSAYAAKKDGKWEEVVTAIRNAPTGEELKLVVTDVYGAMIARWPDAWREELTTIYEDARDALKAKEAA